MQNNRKKFPLIVLSLALLAGSIPSIAFADIPSPPIKIGVCFALTGAGAKWAEAQRSGVEYALHDLRAQGKNLEVIFQDTQTKTAESVACIKRMTEVEGVAGVIGDVWSMLTTAMMPIAQARRVPLMTIGTFKRLCPVGNDAVFSVSEQFEGLDRTYRDFFASKPEIRKVGVVYFDDGQWGEGGKDAVLGAAKGLGLEVAGAIPTIEMRPDFKTILLTLLRKNPDAIVIFHEPTITTKALRDLKYKGIIVQANAIGEVIPMSGRANEMFNGVYFADTYIPEQFEKPFREIMKRRPVLQPYTSYLALMSLFEGIERNRKDPIQGLRSAPFKIFDTEFSFAETCAPIKSRWNMFRIVDGVVEQLSP